MTRRALYLRGTASRVASYWRGSRTSESSLAGVILTETSLAITTESDSNLETET